METSRRYPALLLATLSLVGCGERSPDTATMPTAPTASAEAATTFDLSGTVFHGTPAGVRRVAGAEFEVHVLDGAYRGIVVTDGEGRYRVTNLPQGTAVALAYSRGAQPVEQQCVASTTIAGHTVLDVELGTSDGSRPRSPTVFGTVYRLSTAGREAVANASVWFDWDCLDGLPEAFTRTNGEGRYELCRIPRRGCLAAAAPDAGLASLLLDIGSDTLVDLQLSAAVGAAAPR